VFNATTFTLVATLNNPTPASGDDFGISVAVSGNTVVVGAFSDDTGAFNSGSAYVFDATTGGLVTTLNNPTPASSDWFGYSVAASGNSIVVGAYGDNTGATDAGSAYLFNAASGALIFTLNNPTPALQDWFGESVAVSGATVVVGARNANTAYVFNGTSGTLVATVNDPTPSSVEYFGETVAVSGNAAVVGDKGGAGSAYVFNATTGVLIATLNNPTQPYDERFGYSVAVSGNTVVVGAFLDAGYNGSAYVFNAATGALVVKLNDPTPEFDDEFGISVAVSGNVVVVGAWDDNTGASQSGAAYVFNATTGALVATLNNPTPAAGDTFGATVAVSGNTVVVGAQHDDTGATNAGSAYVFNATTGALIATINNPTPDADDEFGNSVAVSGNTVVVGAYQDLAGYAYVFDAGSGALIVTLNNPTPANGDRFGASVAVSGNTVVVGANSDNTGFPDSGSAYLFNATTGALIATLNNPTPANGDTFGDSVAVSGNTAVVGGSHDNTGTTAAGSAYVFNATTGALVDTMNNPTPASYDYFGYSVAVSGSTVVVGALWDDTFNTDQGAAYVYSIAAPTVQTVQVNDGSAQRSRVTSLTVRFDSQVTFTGAVANAFTFTRNGGVTVNFAAAASVVNGVTVVTIDSFTGTETQFGSLADGRYTLTALASQISANGQQMASDYHFGDAQGLFRIFGDVDGDQTVNGFDLGFFRNAFGTQTGDPNYLSYLDLNGDGVINGFDLGQFRTRFGTMLP
jgi:outer membrane protein assembly factor BamB